MGDNESIYGGGFRESGTGRKNLIECEDDF